MYCETCNAELPLQSAYCYKCGVLVAGGAALTEQRRLYSLWRAGILTFVSLGLYFPYWMYVSWKQLMTELPEKKFYPGWHAFSPFVPIYNLIVLFQHFHTIQTIQKKKWAPSSIHLGVLASIIIVKLGIVWIVYLIGGLSLFLLMLIFTVPLAATGIVVWGQANLNSYWGRANAPPVRSAAIGPGESIITATGGSLVLAIVFLFIYGSVLPPPGITSVSQVTSVERVVVGEQIRSLGIISDTSDADGYMFLARKDHEYTIEVRSASVGDILVEASVTLWDSNGTTIIRSESARIYAESKDTPIVMEWTAPSTATRYVTVQSRDFSVGAYTIRVYLARPKAEGENPP